MLARHSVDNLLSFDGECDFVRDFALHYPLRVIMSLFGVPPEDEPKMLKLTQEFFGVHDPEEQRPEMVADPVVAAKQWAASIEDFYTYFDRLSAQRREQPTDDLLSLIANSRINGAPIPRDEANGYYVAIATAGHDTTSSSTAGGLHGMMAYPENWAKVKADPALIPGLVDEAIRNDVRAGEAEQRRAALAYAARRRVGPWGSAGPDRAAREKQIAAMLRAGHGFDAARAVVDAASIADAEAWANEVEEFP